MCACVRLVCTSVLVLIVHVIFLEEKDNPSSEKMEIVIDKDIFIASVSMQ